MVVIKAMRESRLKKEGQCGQATALIEVLKKKGVMKKQDILDAIRELRKMNPTARTPREFDDPTETPEQGSKQVDGKTSVEELLE